MNPFAALQISDDEEEFTTTSATQNKQPKKSKRSLMQPINRENRPRKPRSERQRTRPNSQSLPTKNSPKDRKKTLARRGITRWFLQKKYQPLAITSIAEVELAEWTDRERKEEAEAESAT